MLIRFIMILFYNRLYMLYFYRYTLNFIDIFRCELWCWKLLFNTTLDYQYLIKLGAVFNCVKELAKVTHTSEIVGIN